jgi:Ca2+-binding RTX toxin-like protein
MGRFAYETLPDAGYLSSTDPWEELLPKVAPVWTYVDAGKARVEAGDLIFELNGSGFQMPGGTVTGLTVSFIDLSAPEGKARFITGTELAIPFEALIASTTGGTGPFAPLWSGNDSIKGSIAADTLRGGAGNDVIAADAGTDRVIGDEGDDSLMGGEGDDLLTGSGGADTLIGGDGNDNLQGGDGEYLVTDGNDRLEGGAGDDYLDGGRGGLDGSGANTLVGGSGNDRYIVALAGDVIFEAASQGVADSVIVSVDKSWNGGSPVYTLPEEVETLLIQWADGSITEPATLSAEGNLLANVMMARDLSYYTSPDPYGEYVHVPSQALLRGLGGNDTLSGGRLDTLEGGVGDDLLSGSGAVRLAGGAGNDTYRINAPGANIVETADEGVRDQVLVDMDTWGTAPSYVLPDNVENLTVTLRGDYGGASRVPVTAGGNGLANHIRTRDVIATSDPDFGETQRVPSDARLNGLGGDDRLVGALGNDTLDGGAGVDTMIGGAGDDTYIVSRIADVVLESLKGSPGTDEVVFSISGATPRTASLGGVVDGLSPSVTYSGIGRLTLGGTAAHRGIGDGSANELVGNAAANRLYGLAGDDRLNGGAGADTLDGGSGNDTYVVDQLADVVREGMAAGIDTLWFFAAGTTARTVSLGGTVPALPADATHSGIEHLTLGGTASHRGIGNAFANVLVGNAAANRLDALGGDDRLDGGGGNDTLAGGAGSDFYRVDSLGDVIVEGPDAGPERDEVQFDVVDGQGQTASLGGSVTSLAAGATYAGVENLTLGTGGPHNGIGSAADNVLRGSGFSNRLYGLAGNDRLVGGNGRDRLDGGSGADTMVGGWDADTMRGGDGADRFVLRSDWYGHEADTVTDFRSGVDTLAVDQWPGVGNGDTTIDAPISKATGGGFAPASELVIIRSNIAGAITADSAAAKIGSASGDYPVDRTALFAVDNGTDSALYLFKSVDGNAIVSASELMLIATLTATPATVVSDFLFV